MTTQIALNLALWLLLLGLIAFSKWDYGVVALGVGLLLIIVGCLDPKTALAKFADSSAVMMPGTLLVATAFSKTKAVGKISSLLYKVGGGNFYRCMALFMVINFLLGFLMGAAMTRIAIVYPLILAVCEQNGKKPSKVMFPIGAMLLCDQTKIPIGSAAVTYVKWNNILTNSNYAYGDAFKMTDMFIAAAPICVIMLLYFIFIGMKIAPEEPDREISELSFRPRKDAKPLTSFQEISAYVIFLGMVILLINASKLGIDQWVITTGCAIGMYMTGVLSFVDGKNAFPFSILFLYIGAIMMGAALVQTGTGAWIGNIVASMLGDHPSSFVMYMAFSVVCIVLTQFMNNGATAELLFPIAIAVCNSVGCSALGVILAISAASLTAWFTPTATIIMPMIIDGGGYSTKTLLKQGLPPAILKTVCSCLWIAFLFPAWG